MSQSAFLVAALLVGFVFYVATTGRLAVYVGVLTGGGKSDKPGAGGTGATGGGTAGQVVGAASSIAEVASMFA